MVSSFIAFTRGTRRNIFCLEEFVANKGIIKEWNRIQSSTRKKGNR
ncbi:hypothetical protein GPDM_08275 [Planococcus donghaensis MPA1U2]|uniref:Uncharacterized protein n=1 Tax=Planococcus donghaensis MPA1U2 TaxID=933115 RepID=E7RGQ7_9BACL|nr:hypothetical protein GPDM_08275 [Planococcus donghaensis MPA1U2]